MWYVWQAKAQTSMHICTVWSEPLLVASIFYHSKATDRTSFGVFKLKRRLHRLVWVYTCQNTTLLEITCCGSLWEKNIYNFTLNFFVYLDLWYWKDYALSALIRLNLVLTKLRYWIGSLSRPCIFSILLCATLKFFNLWQFSSPLISFMELSKNSVKET